MKNYNKETQNDIIESFLMDSIGRNKLLFNFIKFISKIQENEILAINGTWGSGKTYFIKQFELLINFINNYDEKGNIINSELKTNNLQCLKNINKEQINSLNTLISENKENLRELFASNTTNCLYFNAWEYDNNNEPILSILYKIIKDFPYLSTYIKNTEFKKITSIIDGISLTLSNGNFKASDYCSSKNLIDAINTSESIKEQINNIFKKLLEENSNKMIIVIDELDRCNPIYAIKLLEEIKHYINNRNIIIILTTNIQQLSNTIKNIYGNKFQVDEYLDKIIDFTFSLPQINKTEYVKNNIGLESFKSNNWFSNVIFAYIKYRKLEMRSINRFVTLMRLYENHIYLENNRTDKGQKLLEYIFLPYCIGEQIFKSNNYAEFTRGSGYEEFYEYINSDQKLKNIVDNCIYSVAYREEKDLKKDLETLYNSIYNQSNDSFVINIGDIEINTLDIKYYFDLSTMLSDFLM